ncbi:MAG: DUF4388 domain-containing protein [Deltaproteobacteria bacterium]|nr:DUF4388 domain-containing protein [Deltaproteobacteria bacterium]
MAMDLPAALEGGAKVKGTILLAQATRAECDHLQAPLADVGLSVVTATRLENAYELYLTHHPDVMIISPFFTDGLASDLCRRIRTQKNDRKTPIILATSVGSGTLQMEAITRWGVNDVVRLPATFDGIVRLILYRMGLEKTRPNFPLQKAEPLLPAAQSTDAARTLPAAGSLEDAILVPLMRMVAVKKRTGMLHLSSDDRALVYHLLRGELVQVESGHLHGLTFADYLAEQRVVDPERLAVFVKRSVEEKRLLGHLVRKAGLVDDATLRSALVGHWRVKAVHPFSWKTGTYRFEKSTPVQSPDVPIRVGLIDLVLDGVRTSLDVAAYEAEAGNLSRMVFRRVARKDLDIKQLELRPDEKRLIYSLDGEKALGDAMRLANLESDDVVRLVAGLRALGLLRAVGRA